MWAGYGTNSCPVCKQADVNRECPTFFYCVDLQSEPYEYHSKHMVSPTQLMGPQLPVPIDQLVLICPAFHALIPIAWLADEDSLMCCIATMGRQIALYFLGEDLCFSWHG